MFRKPQPQVEQFEVLPVGSIVVKDGKYYRVHDYGLQEVAAPVPLVQPEPTEE